MTVEDRERIYNMTEKLLFCQFYLFISYCAVTMGTDMRQRCSSSPCYAPSPSRVRPPMCLHNLLSHDFITMFILDTAACFPHR